MFDSSADGWRKQAITLRTPLDSTALGLLRYAAVTEADSRDAFAGESVSRATPITTSTADPTQNPVRS